MIRCRVILVTLVTTWEVGYIRSHVFHHIVIIKNSTLLVSSTCFHRMLPQKNEFNPIDFNMTSRSDATCHY